MKIAIVCQNYPPAHFEGGISHYSALLARSLAQLGHEVFAFTSSEFTKPIPNDKPQSGVMILRIRGPWNQSTVGEIRRTAALKNIDAIILQYAPASYKTSFRIRWALTRFSCQKITAFHTLWGRGADKIIALLLLFGSTKIIATNSEIVTLLERHIPGLLKKAYWIPIGSNILAPEKPHTEKTPILPMVSYFGMIYPGKGVDLILAVLDAVKNNGYPFQFKFIGGGIFYHPAYHKAFLDRFHQRQLEAVVEYLGQLPPEEVSKRLQSSRFTFLPYDTGLSDRRGTFMAALAHGQPVLTSPPVVPMTFIKNGFHALWPEKPTVPGYTDCFIRLLTDDRLISRLEQGARELSRHFTWERIASEFDLTLRE